MSDTDLSARRRTNLSEVEGLSDWTMQYKLFALFSAAITYAPRAALGAPTTTAAQTPSSVVTLNKSDLAVYAPFTQFARAAYCPASKLKKWTCGGTYSPMKLDKISNKISLFLLDACKANADFHVTHAGGDGDAVQNCTFAFSRRVCFPFCTLGQHVWNWA